MSLINRFSGNELSTTFVNKYELLKYENRRILDEAMENLNIYYSNVMSTEASAIAYHKLKAKGKMMSDNYLLIFGVCSANSEKLFTQDKAFLALESSMILVVE